MANRNYKPGAMAIEKGLVSLYGKVVTSTSGTISSSDCRGFSIAKTGSETGRYTITLEDKYNALRACNVAVVGAADAAYTNAAGLGYLLRNVDVTTSTLDIQFVNAAQPQADAELENGAEFYIEIVLKNSSVTY